jgi:hypothetical protein
MVSPHPRTRIKEEEMPFGDFTDEKKQQMNEAADKAEIELKAILSKMTPEQRAGFNQMRSWWMKNFMTAGHKRLAHLILYKTI